MEWEGQGETAECCVCHRVTICVLTVDPFLDEVMPEGGPYPDGFWCFDCYQARAEEI